MIEKKEDCLLRSIEFGLEGSYFLAFITFFSFNLCQEEEEVEFSIIGH